MRFSQRRGFISVSEVIQINGMSQELRNSLWSVLDLYMWRNDNFQLGRLGSMKPSEYKKVLWLHYFKQPTDTIGANYLQIIRDYFFKCQWYEVYDFLEFTLNSIEDDNINEAVNLILERDLSGYRFVSGTFTDITAKEEIDMLEEALSNNDYPGVRRHLQRALELLSQRESPDYRNSIKEAISAVESACREITGNTKATLGDALKLMERTNKLHPALKDAFSKLYGYTSDEAGIRHAMLEEPNLDATDAKFFLLICTSFINYIKSKAGSP